MTLYDFLRVVIALAAVAFVAVAVDAIIQEGMKLRKRRKLRRTCSPWMDPRFPHLHKKYTRCPRTRKR